MKNNFIKLTMITLFIGVISCNTAAPEKSESQAQSEKKVDLEAERNGAEKVLTAYRDAIQNLTVENTDQLFTEDSQIFESGGSEGSYATYKDHHLGPELKYFKSFSFNDYKLDMKVDLPYAFATETYVFEIVIAANKEKGREERIITKKGVATVDLKKVDGNWKIVKYHSSSRDVKPGKH